MTTEQEEINRLRFELVTMEASKYEAKREVARLEGQLQEGQHADIERLRQQSVEACVALQVSTDELEELKKKLVKAERIAAEQGACANSQLADMRAMLEVKADELEELKKKLAKAEQLAAEQGACANSQLTAAQAAVEAKVRELEELKKKLADAEQLAADKTARADRATLDAAATRKLNVDLTVEVQVLKQKIASTSTRDDIQNSTPWYKKDRMLWKIAGCMAMILVIVAGIAVLLFKQIENTPKPSCSSDSLTTCADNLVKQVVSGVPSEFIRSRAIYWCKRVGCQ